MTEETYQLVKKFFNRLTAEDFQRRAESKEQAQQMMYAFTELLEESKQLIEPEK